jgi:outer membrane receptor for ferric coprogen and ferric-rhodotorulic acid
MAITSCALLHGQTTPPASAAAQEPVTLSPFVITSTADQSYNPTETLSGTRLRSSTKDVASALTILTPQLMDDLGIVNVEEALSFVTNTEPYGITDDDTAGFSGRLTVKPFRSRGLTTSSFSANFFDAVAPIDRYNTEQLSFMRGPNSILFGTGFAGGMLDAQPKRARFSNHAALDTRFDSLGSWRIAAEANREIVPKKLALQLDVLKDYRYSYRKPAFEDRWSVYGTLNWKISERTSLVVNGEGGEIDKVVPWPLMFFDYYTPWVNAGRRTLAPGQAIGAATGTRVISANNYYVKVENPDGLNLPAMNWRNFATGALPIVGSVARANLPFASQAASPVPLSTAVEGTGNRHDAPYGSFQAIIEHRLAKDLYLEAGINRMTTRFDDLTTIRANALAINVDPNATLPNGQPNPYVGLPYVETNPFLLLQKSNFQENQGRISAAYSLNLDDRKLFRDVGWGRYQFGAFFTGTQTHNYLQQEQETTNVNSFTGLANNAQNFFHHRYYLQPGGQTYMTDKLPHLVQSALAGNAAVPAVDTGFLQTVQGATDQRSRIYGLSLAGQAAWWKERIVYTTGWRTDRTTNTRAQMPIGPNGVFLPFNPATAPWTTITYSGHTVTNGLTFHLTKQLSLFASRSGNFVPPSVNRSDFSGNFLPPVTGRGTEAGVRFDLLNGKITGTVSHYDTTEKNRADSLISKNKQVWVQYMWDAIRGPGYYIAPANPFTDVVDRKSSGYELQLTASPVESIRIYGNLSKADVVASNVDRIFAAYYNQNLATWQGNTSRPVNDFASLGFRTVGDVLNALTQEFTSDLAASGRQPVATREWTGSTAVTYLFPRRFLPGLRFTARGSWRSAPIVGYLLDGRTPIMGRSEETYDLSLTYERKLKLGTHQIKASLTAQVLNLLDTQRPVPYTAVAYGASPGDYYIAFQHPPAPRLFQYSLRLAF